MVEAIEEERAVGEVGQWIMQGSVLQQRLESPPLADVSDHGDRLRSIRGVDRAEGDVRRELGAVFGADAQVLCCVAHGSVTGAGGVVVPTISSVDRPECFRHQQLDWPAEQLAKFVARQQHSLAVGKDYSAGPVADDHSVRDPIQRTVVGQPARFPLSRAANTVVGVGLRRHARTMVRLMETPSSP